jgi:ABC-type branched-subunit amino acid transport system ATPase component
MFTSHTFYTVSLYHLTAKPDAHADSLRLRLKKKMEMARAIYLNRKEESVRSE